MAGRSWSGAAWVFYYDRGELFSYLSPGYAAGEVTAGPFGVNQTPPFVNAVQCSIYASPGQTATPASPCTPDASGTFTLSNPWGTVAGNPADRQASDISKYLPNAADIVNGAQLFSFANYDRTNKLPYTINYTLDVQFQPRPDLAITLGYVGNLGRHQVVPIPFNQANIASPTNVLHPGAYQQKYTTDIPCRRRIIRVRMGTNSCAPATLPDGSPYQFNYEGGNIDLRVPYIGYSSESETYKAAGVSAYNALTAHVEKRLSHGLQVGFLVHVLSCARRTVGYRPVLQRQQPPEPRDGYASADFDRTMS